MRGTGSVRWRRFSGLRRGNCLHAAQWARLSAGLTGLDANLDRTWAAEQERIRRSG